MSIADNLKQYKNEVESDGVKLIAVSKTQSIESILEAYNAGQRIFGENQVQEMVDKQAQLPTDIEWHLIGHLQTNKVKYICLGFDEAIELLRSEEYSALKNIRIVGVMGIATNTKNEKQIAIEFNELKVFFDGLKLSFFRKDDAFKEISSGMSADYKIAIEEGSTMVRIGSSIFGKRVIKHFKNDISAN